MSVWANANIYMTIKKNSGCSLRTLIIDTFSEAMINKYVQCGQNEEYNRIDCEFVYSEDGLQAARSMESLIKQIKEFDKTAYVDATVEIRF